MGFASSIEICEMVAEIHGLLFFSEQRRLKLQLKCHVHHPADCDTLPPWTPLEFPKFSICSTIKWNFNISSLWLLWKRIQIKCKDFLWLRFIHYMGIGLQWTVLAHHTHFCMCFISTMFFILASFHFPINLFQCLYNFKTKHYIFGRHSFHNIHIFSVCNYHSHYVFLWAI